MQKIKDILEFVSAHSTEVRVMLIVFLVMFFILCRYAATIKGEK